jgi:hypothetical protein
MSPFRDSTRMTPIVSHTVKDVPTVPNALILKNVGFGNTQGSIRPVQRLRLTMQHIALISLLFLVAINVSAQAKSPSPVPVQVKRVTDEWLLLRDGKPYYINGAGGSGSLELLKQLGGNSIRTWSADSLERRDLLANTQRLGLTIAAGLALGQERHGFSYNEPAQVKKQFDESIASVEKFKNEPSILIRGIGNELEGDGTHPALWKAINDISREIHRRDPNHPTMTVIAGVAANRIKLRNFMQYCPSTEE